MTVKDVDRNVCSERVWKKLEEWGADVPQALVHLQGDGGFYLHLIGQLLKEQYWIKVEKAVEERDVECAFRYAHEMKGVAHLLGLAPLYGVTDILAQLLKNRKALLSMEQEGGQSGREMYGALPGGEGGGEDLDQIRQLLDNIRSTMQRLTEILGPDYRFLS